MIKITKPLVEILDEFDIPTGNLACTGMVDSYTFHHSIPTEFTESLDATQAYLEENEELIKTKAIKQVSASSEPIYPTADTLPKSQHIGKITAANPANAKPVTVTRRFMGQNYDYQCLISQSVKDMYTAGDLAIGDYVIVSFIEEHPNESEKQIAIVVDKVFKSW